MYENARKKKRSFPLSSLFYTKENVFTGQTAGTSVNWYSKGKSDFSIYVHGVSNKEEFSWDKLESDINYWARPLRPVQV